MHRMQGLVASLDRNSLSVARERFGFTGRNIMVGIAPTLGHPTSGPSYLTEADELLARKERSMRCFALAASTGFGATHQEPLMPRRASL